MINLLLAPLGGWLYRLRGMNKDDVPALLRSRLARRMAYSACVGAATVPVLGVYACLVPFLAYLGVVIGHGSYFPGGGPKIDNESTRWLTKSPMSEAMKMWGMSLTGLMMTVPIGILIWVVSDPLLGLFVGLSGFLKGAVYFTPGIDTEKAEAVWGITSVLSIGLLSLL